MAVFATNELVKAMQVTGLQLQELSLQWPDQRLSFRLSRLHYIMLCGTGEIS